MLETEGYCVGQKTRSGFPIMSYEKNQTNFFANTTQRITHEKVRQSIALWKQGKWKDIWAVMSLDLRRQVMNLHWWFPYQLALPTLSVLFLFFNHFLQLFLPTGSFTVDHEHFFFFPKLLITCIYGYSLSCIGEGSGNSSTLAWKIPWTEDPGGLPSMGSHRVGHDWSDLAAAAAAAAWLIHSLFFSTMAHFYGFVQPVIPLLTLGFSAWFYFRFWRLESTWWNSYLIGWKFWQRLCHRLWLPG